MTKKKVYIAYTGGTIGMNTSVRGFVPTRGYFRDQVMRLAELKADAMPEIHVEEYPRLLDSSNITPHDWYKITEDIENHYDQYDGFVVLHGTDTMAYTASALSFMLQDLSKPVIVTGSQIPWSQMRTDAKDNLMTSVLLAANHAIPEVGLYFHNRLYRGNRARKVDASGFHAFQSPNFPALVEVGTEIKVHQELLLRDPSKPLSIQRIDPPKVAMLTLFPGFSAPLLNSVLAAEIDGLVLMTYGMGNAPSNDKSLLDSLKKATESGVVVVNCSQCYRGQVDMSGYQTGQALLECGVIGASDMTPEATLTKLSYLLSTGSPLQTIKQQMQISLRGELTAVAST